MKIFNIFKKKEKECKHDEYCPIYLAYVDNYGKNSKEVKHCKNSNQQYCTKYRLIDEKEWKNLGYDAKLKIIKDMKLIEFIDSK